MRLGGWPVETINRMPKPRPPPQMVKNLHPITISLILVVPCSCVKTWRAKDEYMVKPSSSTLPFKSRLHIQILSLITSSFYRIFPVGLPILTKDKARIQNPDTNSLVREPLTRTAGPPEPSKLSSVLQSPKKVPVVISTLPCTWSRSDEYL